MFSPTIRGLILIVLSLGWLVLIPCCLHKKYSQPVVFQPHTAVNATLQMDQGATLNVVFTWLAADGVTPINLTGYTVAFHVLQTTGTLTDWSSYCVLGGTAGTITLTVPATVTATYTSAAPAGFGFYQITLTAGDGVTKYRPWQGTVILNPSVGWLILPRGPLEDAGAGLVMAA